MHVTMHIHVERCCVKDPPCIEELFVLPNPPLKHHIYPRDPNVRLHGCMIDAILEVLWEH